MAAASGLALPFPFQPPGGAVLLLAFAAAAAIVVALFCCLAQELIALVGSTDNSLELLHVLA